MTLLFIAVTSLPRRIVQRLRKMSRRCELTGKMALTGNNVSHAKNKTKRRFLPNLNMVSLASEKLEKTFKFKVSASALRSVDKKGGLDLFLLNSSEKNLSPSALKLKKDLENFDNPPQ